MNKSFIAKWLFEVFCLLMGWASIFALSTLFLKLFFAVWFWAVGYGWIVSFMVDEAEKNSIILWGR